MQAMIFAAGLGTRLKPLTDSRPKALVEVKGQPLLWHVIMKLKDAGFTRLVVNVHHFASQITDYLRAQENFGMDIRISDESRQLLDTGGGIRAAAPLFATDCPILIHNVDIFSNADLASFYRQAAEADATLLVSRRATNRYLLFNSDRQLKGWTNVSTGEMRGPVAEGGAERSSLCQYAFSGIHVFSPRLFPMMQSWGECFGIIDFYLQACATADIRGVVQEDLRLLDVGKTANLREAENPEWHV